MRLAGENASLISGDLCVRQFMQVFLFGHFLFFSSFSINFMTSHSALRIEKKINQRKKNKDENKIIT